MQRKKNYISKEDLAKVQELDLFTYFMNYDPDELVRKSRNVYTTKSHGSLNIKTNGLWYWWSHGIGGKSAFQYFRDVEGVPWQDAVLYLKRLMEQLPPKPCACAISSFPKSFSLPTRNGDDEIAKSYLINERKIDSSIVETCIRKQLIYETLNNHAIAFVGCDAHHFPRFCCLRATDDKWKKDVYGSDKRFSFQIRNNKSTILHVFESPIDLLSYMTIQKLDGKEIWNQNYLSIDGATGLGADIKDGNIPIALEHFLENNNVKYINLHLDNDRAGKDTTKKIQYALDKNYIIFDEPPTKYKDVNEQLINRSRMKIEKMR